MTGGTKIKNHIVFKVAFFSCIFYNIAFITLVTVFHSYFFADSKALMRLFNEEPWIDFALYFYNILGWLFLFYFPTLKIVLSRQMELPIDRKRKDKIAFVIFLIAAVLSTLAMMYWNPYMLYNRGILVWIELYSLSLLYFLYLVHQSKKIIQ